MLAVFRQITLITIHLFTAISHVTHHQTEVYGFLTYPTAVNPRIRQQVEWEETSTHIGFGLIITSHVFTSCSNSRLNSIETNLPINGIYRILASCELFRTVVTPQ